MQPFKSAPQILGMQRRPSVSRRTGRVSRHRASSPSGLCCEAAPRERASVSETLDRSRTPLNVNLGPESGEELWHSMCEEAGAARVRMVARDGTEHERGLRQDAVIGYAWIDHPPAEVTADWDDDTMMRFTRDSMEAANDVLASMGRPRMFGGANERATYVHRGEGMPADPATAFEGVPGVHAHRFGVCRDPETGAWCGSAIDARFLSELDRRYPALMRERGWPLLDLDTTDYGRMATDEGYAKERRARGARHGRSTNEYRRDRMLEDMADAFDMAVEANRAADAARAEADRVREAAATDARAVRRQAQDEARQTRQATARERDEALTQAEASRAEAERARAEAELSRHQARSLGEGGGLDWNGPGEGRTDMGPEAGAYRWHEPSVREAREERKAEEAARDEAASELAATRAELETATAALAAANAGLGRARDAAAERERADDDARRAFEDAARRREDELARLDAEVAARRGDLEVAVGRRAFRLADVVGRVIDACASVLDGIGATDVGAYLRRCADGITSWAIDGLAPETRQPRRQTRRSAAAPAQARGRHDDIQLGG